MPDSNIPAGSSPEKSRHTEGILVVILLSAVLLANLTTAMRYPTVWQDEVMCTDPAANLVLGKGFTSTAWYDQTGDKFWAGNAALHEIILSGWIRIFGFSPLAVRSINYVWFVLGIFLVWRFCVRLPCIQSTRWRLLLIVLLASNSAVSFSYRSGRSDMVGFFLSALALYAATIPKSNVRYLCLLGIGILFPWAGLQLLPMLVIAAVLLLVFWGVRAALNCVSIGMGAVIGLLGLYWFYQSHGVWNDFVASITRHTVGPQAQIYAHGRISALPAVFMRDRSAPFLMLLGALLAIHAWRIHDARGLKITLFALAVGVCIPLGLHFIGIFPIYYGWMVALPLTIMLCHVMSRQPPAPFWGKGAAILLLLGAIFIGLPARLAVAVLRSNEQPYSAAESFISKNLNADDRVYINYAAFYPAMRTAGKVYTLRYMEYAMTPEERNNVTALVIEPEEMAGITNQIPGRWEMTAEFKNNDTNSLLPSFLARHLQSPTTRAVYFRYHFAVYRKYPDEQPQNGK
jgi:hypothetical protein